ncbi:MULTISPECIES: response regulator [Caballeronia]|uniref:Response regulator n=1 Tax=Caballeronia zhejiangensis TaxID=871203 RepID=A0A656QA73_9BURK|nr:MULTISPECIES: response regulator [Caballeronia]KDR25518.1 response regulator [Caballeronia zhejiangensis]
MPPVAVLLVDDDAAVAEALAAALIAYGCRALVAPGGWAALAITESWVPQVVVLDIEMPDIDGFAVARAMRGSTRFATVPILAHSSLAEAEIVERGVDVGIDAFYRKGESLHGLFQMIEYLAPVRYL